MINLLVYVVLSMALGYCLGRIQVLLRIRKLERLGWRAVPPHGQVGVLCSPLPGTDKEGT